jgi:hypothetical protein
LSYQKAEPSRIAEIEKALFYGGAIERDVDYLIGYDAINESYVFSAAFFELVLYFEIVKKLFATQNRSSY